MKMTDFISTIISISSPKFILYFKLSQKQRQNITSNFSVCSLFIEIIPKLEAAYPLAE